MHLLPYAPLLLTAAAVSVPLWPRLDPCQQVADNETPDDDGITSDRTAGIGIEFEAPVFYFTNPACSLDDTFAAKKQLVGDSGGWRTGTNFMLTADTSSEAGKITAEYILDGRNIKVGSGDAARAGAAATADLVSPTVTQL